MVKYKTEYQTIKMKDEKLNSESSSNSIFYLHKLTGSTRAGGQGAGGRGKIAPMTPRSKRLHNSQYFKVWGLIK